MIVRSPQKLCAQPCITAHNTCAFTCHFIVTMTHAGGAGGAAGGGHALSVQEAGG